MSFEKQNNIDRQGSVVTQDNVPKEKATTPTTPLCNDSTVFAQKDPKKWRNIRIAFWFLLTLIITMGPLMMKNSWYSHRLKRPVQGKYVAPTVLTMHFFTSIFLGAGLSYFLYGIEGLKGCMDWNGILLQVPVSVGYAVSETIALFAMRVSDPITYAVVHKIRLLEVAMLTRVFLRRHVSLLTWACSFTLTFTVMSFVLYNVSSKKGSSQSWREEMFGIVLLLLNITVSVSCSVYGDYIYKKLEFPLSVQMSQGRVSATLGAAVLACGVITKNGWWKYGFFGGPGGGWDRNVVFLYSFMIMRDWTTCFVLLHLDAIWKALAGSAAVGTTYFLEVLIYKKKVIPTLFCLMLSIIGQLTIYAIIKQKEKYIMNIEKQKEELKNKVEAIESNSATRVENIQ